MYLKTGKEPCAVASPTLAPVSHARNVNDFFNEEFAV